MMKLNSRGKQLDLSLPQVMGILNVTPDSFSDGGCFSHLDAAVRQAERMAADGAAESSRTGAGGTAPGRRSRRAA